VLEAIDRPIRHARVGPRAAAWFFYRGSAHALSEKDTVVLADFVNRTGDAAFDDTLKQALDVSLRQSPFLAMLADDSVVDTLRLMAWFERQHLPPPETRVWVETFAGHLQAARDLTRGVVQAYVRSDSPEPAAIAQTFGALREAAVGRADLAAADAADGLKLAPGSRDVESRAALAYALAGDGPRAQALVDDLIKRFPKATLVQSLWVPTIRAQLALNRGRPDESLELLRATPPYDLAMSSSFPVGMLPAYVRGQANLAAHDGAAAAAEFQRILDHPGVVWNSPTYALARLGLARAHAQGSPAKARDAYKSFLDLWNDADADIPILIKTRAEFAALR
jgi:hypothetical protein